MGLIRRIAAISTMINESQLAKGWMKAYVYTLAQHKREIAPIDEPCIEWVRLLKPIFYSLEGREK